MRRRAVLWTVATAYGVAGLALVLTPISHVLHRLTVRLYVIGTYDLHIPGLLPETFETALNVLLFVPLGVLVVLGLERSWIFAVVASAIVSTTIELVQLIPALNRQSSVTDVLVNVAGGAIGAVGATIAPYLTGRRRRLSSSED